MAVEALMGTEENYRSGEERKQDIFNYIELFYNPTRRHGSNFGRSEADYKKSHLVK